MNKFFKVNHNSNKSKARLGKIITDHGIIKTPSFVAVGTKGTIKALTPQLVKEIGTQVAFVNTYHLVTHPGTDIIKAAGGIHKYSGLNIPLMSDSGGFQVFSLASPKRQFIAKEGLIQNNKTRQRNFLSQRGSLRQAQDKPFPESVKNLLSSSSDNQTKKSGVRGEEDPLLVKISEDGVKFRSTYDGTLIEFTPEKSMEYQRQIGADINMAFDECTYYPATHKYAERAMNRTHEWLKRCINFKAQQQNFLSQRGPLRQAQDKPFPESEKKLLSSPNFSLTTSPQSLVPSPSQYLYGVIQGGTFEDLRKKSAEFVISQDTPGVAIGGVSVGETKKEMREQVKWVSDYLSHDRPVHLLGVGQIDDIIDLIKYGIDTFDCVEPTRLARMGQIYRSRISDFSTASPQRGSKSLTQNQMSSLSDQVDITKSIYKSNFEKVDVDCECYVCKNFTKSYLHHLFKQREILGYTLATFHNLWVMEKLFENIREAIGENKI
jgi:queuine tRNA-ribosyltransferase